MIRTVFLDLDDTILDFHKAEALSIREVLAIAGIDPTDEVVARYSEINRLQWEALERREITRDEVLTRRFSLLFAELGVDFPASEARRTYEARLSTRGILLPGAKELLETLKATGKYRLCLASNGTAHVQAGRIADAGIAPYFEKRFVSEEVGFDKPDPRFFDACFAALPGAMREEAVIVGDSLSSDILGGKNAGIRTVWYHRAGKKNDKGITPDAEIASLDELPALLEKL